MGYKSNMVAYTLAAISMLTNKALNLEAIWNEQCVITPSVYNEIEGDIYTIIAKLLTGNRSVTYKVKVPYTTSAGKRANKWEIKTISEADIRNIEATTLYKVMQIVAQIEPIIWNHIVEVDAGSNINEYTKKPTCWSELCAKHIGQSLVIPSEILTSKEDFQMTPSMQKTYDTANDYDYETWHDINIWGKQTGLISPKETAFMGSIYYWSKRGKELSYKQAKYALDILRKARAAGWEE